MLPLYPSQSYDYEFPRIARWINNKLQNFGMSMPGWYDIVRSRDTVRALNAPNPKYVALWHSAPWLMRDHSADRLLRPQ